MHTRWLMRRSLGRQFEWLWAAYAVSATGSALERTGGEVVEPSEFADQRSRPADELTDVHRGSSLDSRSE